MYYELIAPKRLAPHRRTRTLALIVDYVHRQYWYICFNYTYHLRCKQKLTKWKTGDRPNWEMTYVTPPQYLGPIESRSRR